MLIQGTISNGVVVLNNGAKLPDGTPVSVRPLKKTLQRKPRRKRLDGARKELLKFAGTCKGLPPDLALNHDHYLYGTPKR